MYDIIILIQKKTRCVYDYVFRKKNSENIFIIDKQKISLEANYSDEKLKNLQ